MQRRFTFIEIQWEAFERSERVYIIFICNQTSGLLCTFINVGIFLKVNYFGAEKVCF